MRLAVGRAWATGPADESGRRRGNVRNGELIADHAEPMLFEA